MRLQMSSLSMKITRVLLYKLISCVRTCRNILYQMFSKARLENVWNGLNRSRKIMLCCLVALVLLLYWWPSWLRHSNTNVRIDIRGGCIASRLKWFMKQGIHEFDVLPKHSPLELDEKDYVQYVGNGYVATSLQERSKLYIRHNQALSQSVLFYPVVSVDISGFQAQEVSVTNIRHGVISKVQCFQVSEHYCVSATQSMYAHRARPSILVQEFRIHNPADTPVTVDLEQIGLSGWKDAVIDNKRAEQIKSNEIKYTLITGTHPVQDSSTRIHVVAIAAMQLPVTVTVQASSTWSHHILTAVKYTQMSRDEDVTAMRRELEAAVDAEFNSVVIVNSKLLREEHMQVWDKLWFSGFGISKSLAPGAINGDNINMTLYYVMSNTLSPIHDLTTQPSHKRELEKLLYFPDRCYENHHTVQNERMWVVPKSVHRLNELVTTWVVTLSASSCGKMLQAGADGALQSMMLSIGGLQFKDQHLEFRTQPKDLHRDYFWRRLNYGNNTHLNLSVIVGEDNKAMIHAALDRNDRNYYACEAGCLDKPVKLSRNLEVFAVRLTDPLTPLIYITYDKPHMEQLKHTIHVKEIKLAPAHEHHVIAMHRHGHHLGGLPVLFWGSLGVLILIFHLFLCKLIYNEYCTSPQDRYTRTRYSL